MIQEVLHTSVPVCRHKCIANVLVDGGLIRTRSPLPVPYLPCGCPSPANETKHKVVREAVQSLSSERLHSTRAAPLPRCDALPTVAGRTDCKCLLSS